LTTIKFQLCQTLPNGRTLAFCLNPRPESLPVRGFCRGDYAIIEMEAA
jgi:hypothetical protein